MSTNRNKKPVLLFPELSYILTGICFAAHNELGEYAREKQYADAIEKYLKEKNINYKRELAIGTGGNILDFLIENQVVLELKAKRLLLREDFRQIQNYLQQTELRLGLLVNFREKLLKPRRIVRIERIRQIKL
ncbi:MAG: hypothetical protein A3C08_03615 [Candidatus Taylorbacteria bacterium RIFCSPHIGHO2_02_FULL_47_18]|uniref:GxxExxY protein n=1 Tax=Candidatus Taylorbacteria bacterium RIFCSPLOWO2_01_FULL_48_100 TaxID=1802322 RepID=A0A1G2NCX5_9BACT|nr:MAG: hypothetical protein A2670_00825 [Candidatus Taylorbacteria bacterium RIFCSPHIGHO2_01_FULL_48_38]OHA28250.1 MAG: hypothetical protein A3C08_03615 [Candidatus Taylorbacteria bacterium RIFCSPHIGHO2_02_FULL_47_18]OHA33947.1 MAG: hypothetical protein A2938_02615 [Candidatus Taylorbacteria bacterium RIFCSPLOWO2_01_FULL_48_100]OHA40932.1 MAG: hypothetical protein A3J31_03625 [Candidatus Taylorbacteria bacterium RIFCSPLOWO2_02_FULL_48_16]OHA45138.1 MAG: hypothetical protein A3H13_02960 [Candid